MTRAAVTVFIETDHEGDQIDAGVLFKMALRQATDNKLSIKAKHWDKPLNITIYDAMETGMAAGNGYLWLQPTSKAFPRPEQETA